VTLTSVRRDLIVAVAVLVAAGVFLVWFPHGGTLGARVMSLPSDPDGLLWLVPLAALLLAFVVARQFRRLRRENAALVAARSAVERVEARDRLLFDRSPQPMWLYDEETLRFLAVNEAAVEQYGYTRAEFLQLTIRDIRPPEQLAPLEDILRGPQSSRHIARLVRHRTKDRTILDVDIHSHRVMFEGRQARLVLASNVTGRERALRALRESEAHLQASEARFRQLAEHIPSVFYLTDAATRRVLYVSPAYETVWGQPPEALYADPRASLDLVHPDDRARAAAHAASSMRGPSEIEYRLLRADGSVRWVNDRSFPVRDAAGRVTSVAGIATDVTDPRRLEQELLQAQKLESVGRLAGGVAQDFNNLFTIILSRVALMLGDARGGEFAEELRDVRHAAERAASLTQQLLTFARRQVMAPQMIELNDGIAGMQESVRAIAGEGVAVQFVPGGTPARVRVDPDALQQIVLNLAANAVDAMPDGGVIGIAVHGDESLPFDADEDGRRQGVCLEISDTGTGIPADVMPHIFEPFYTTKSREHGTGLGLAAVHGLVRQAGGEIRVRSEHGIGTCFTIWLPVVESDTPAPEAARVRVLLEAAAVTREATVLVVEDEPAVRSIACRVLASAGYRVLEASDGHAAIDLALSHKGRIDLLLSDVIMPHMGGHELASRFGKLRPETRVLLTSGYTQDWSFVGSAGVDAPAFLTKPYAPTALLEKVRAVIGEAVGQV